MLKSALKDYSFPCVAYDFEADKLISASRMEDIEDYIHSKLLSSDATEVKYGLANILYWGYAQIGYRDVRVGKFYNHVTTKQLDHFINLVESERLGCSRIKDIGMPQYSGMSFISKILMFYDPSSYCILDNQILKMRDGTSPGSLNKLNKSPKETIIRINKNNELLYQVWCEECRKIAHRDDLGRHRAVDAERAFFALIQAGSHKLAKSLYDQFCIGNEIAEDLFSKNVSPPDNTSIISENIWDDVDV